MPTSPIALLHNISRDPARVLPLPSVGLASVLTVHLRLSNPILPYSALDLAIYSLHSILVWAVQSFSITCFLRTEAIIADRGWRYFSPQPLLRASRIAHMHSLSHPEADDRYSVNIQARLRKDFESLCYHWMKFLVRHL
jgi:hypothetical protein